MAFAVVSFILGYALYSRWIARKIFFLDNKNDLSTPAVRLRDGIDFTPASRKVLFCHHYTSIAGAAPIMGPAVAVIWGWVPAFIWIVAGVVFMGAVHDFSTLVLSMRHDGESIGKVAERILGPRIRTVFLLVIFFLVWMVLAVFSLVVAGLFVRFPGSVIPIKFEIIVALAIGLLTREKEGSLLWPSLLAQAALFIMIGVGASYPLSLPMEEGNQIVFWVVLLLGLGFVTSILPVWVLLRPRDYINGHQLFLCLFLLMAGVCVVQPEIVAPAFNHQKTGAPPWFPFLFVTLACGAISGFHGLVSGGTTSKQVGRWEDARSIGYGGMLGEGLLAVLAVLAVACGLDSTETWHAHYSSWDEANSLSAKIGVFVTGSGKFLKGLGIPTEFSHTLIAVLIISFAATSMDTAFRIQRYILGELGRSFKFPLLENRFYASGFGVLCVAFLVFVKSEGRGALSIWPLFGATNQMLAGFSLLIVSVYLWRKKKKTLPFLIPSLLILGLSATGLIFNMMVYFEREDWFLFVLGILLFVCFLWIVGEGLRAFGKNRDFESMRMKL